MIATATRTGSSHQGAFAFSLRFVATEAVPATFRFRRRSAHRRRQPSPGGCLILGGFWARSVVFRVPVDAEGIREPVISLTRGII